LITTFKGYEMKKLYRYSYQIDHSNFFTLAVDVKFIKEEYFVLKETEKSYIINYGFRQKVVRKKGINLFAFDTEEKAFYNFTNRKKSQQEHLKAKLAVINTVVEKIDKEGFDGQNKFRK